ALHSSQCLPQQQVAPTLYGYSVKVVLSLVAFALASHHCLTVAVIFIARAVHDKQASTGLEYTIHVLKRRRKIGVVKRAADHTEHDLLVKHRQFIHTGLPAHKHTPAFIQVDFAAAQSTATFGVQIERQYSISRLR